MIYIRKGGHRRRVTQHAFDTHWRRLGYEIVEAEPVEDIAEEQEPDALEETDDEQEPEAPNEPQALGTMTIAELRAYADAQNIDLSGATRKDDIIAVIQAAEAGL